MAYAALLIYVVVLFVRPQEWMPLLYGVQLQKAVMGVALATWLGSLMAGRWSPKAAPQNWLMIGLFGATLMSHASHTFFAQVVSTFKDFGKIVLVYFLVSSLLTDVRRTKGLILVMALGCLFMAADGYWQWQSTSVGPPGTVSTPGVGITGTTPVIQHGVVRVRATGIFGDPNDLALMLVTVLPFLLTNVWRPGHGGASRVLSAVACVPIGLCIFFTNSRGGWLAFGVMLMAYVAVHVRRRKLGIVVAALVLLIVISLGPSRIGVINTQEGSTHGRIIAWGSANYMLKSYPLFGVGYGLFTHYSNNRLVAHNSFAHCWAELGMFGYFFWLALVLASFKDAWALSNAAGEDPEKQEYEQLGKASFAAFAGFMAASLFLSRTYIVPLYVMFGLVAALRTTYERDHGRLEHAFRTRDLFWVAAAAAVSVPALWQLIRISG